MTYFNLPAALWGRWLPCFISEESITLCQPLCVQCVSLLPLLWWCSACASPGLSFCWQKSVCWEGGNSALFYVQCIWHWLERETPETLVAEAETNLCPQYWGDLQGPQRSCPRVPFTQRHRCRLPTHIDCRSLAWVLLCEGIRFSQSRNHNWDYNCRLYFPAFPSC